MEIEFSTDWNEKEAAAFIDAIKNPNIILTDELVEQYAKSSSHQEQMVA